MTPAKQTALTAKPLPLAARKALLASLVKEGKVSAASAKMVDFRELTDHERAHAKTLVPLARKAFARQLLKGSEHVILSCALLVSVLAGENAFAQSPTPFAGFGAKSFAAAEKKDYLGEWEGHLTDGDGSNPGQRRMNMSLTITEKTITSSGQGNVRGEGTYKVSGGGGKFRRIDAMGTSGQYQGKVYEGIFTVEGDTLKWCSGNPGKGRPSELRTNTGAGHFLMVLTRKK